MKHMKRIIERMRKAIPKDIPKTVVLKKKHINVIVQNVISESFVKAQKIKQCLV